MFIGKWQVCLFDIDRASEFTGDDVDRYSKLVNLGRPFERLLLAIIAPITSALSIYVQEDASEATVPKQLNYVKPETATHAAWTTTAGTGSQMISCDYLNGYKYVRIYSGADLPVDRTIRICGVRS